MNALRIAAIALIVAGALGLAYGSFSFTKQTHQAKALSVNYFYNFGRSLPDRFLI